MKGRPMSKTVLIVKGSPRINGNSAALAERVYAGAKAAGAKGVQLSGICCTANEILMRQGIPAAGNVLHQELSILTGAA